MGWAQDLIKKAGNKNSGGTPATPDPKPSGMQKFVEKNNTWMSNALNKMGDKWGFINAPQFQAAFSKMSGGPFAAMLPKPKDNMSAPPAAMPTSSPKTPPAEIGGLSSPKIPPQTMATGGFYGPQMDAPPQTPMAAPQSALPPAGFDSQGWQQVMGGNPQALMANPQPVPPPSAPKGYTAFGLPATPPKR